MSVFSRLWSRPHLWRNPTTRHYHDPVVLYRQLDALESRDAAHLRGPLMMTAPVLPDGSGYAESQVIEAFNDFVGWYEKKA